MHLHETTADRLYRRVLDDLLGAPIVSPRGRPTYERLGVQLVLLYPDLNIVSHPVRNLNHQFAVAEWVWIALGLNDLQFLAPYNRQIRNYAEEGVLPGAYGPPLKDQWWWVKRKLQEDPDTRQAVINLWRPRPTESKDTPCTLSLQFLLRQHQLRLIVTMRSNDAWLGLPYDLFTFTQLQRLMAAELGVGVGEYIHNVGSMHLYAEDYAKAQNLYASDLFVETPHSPALTPMPAMFQAMAMNLALMQETIHGTEASINQWVLPNAAALPDPWGGYLLLLASRFTKDYGHLYHPYRGLYEQRQLEQAP